MKKKRTARKKVVFSPYAWGVAAAYLGWGAEGAWNRNEQICALGGRIEGNIIRVEAALPMLGAEASPGHVKIMAETWLAAIWTLKDMGMELTGSIHSHPNALSLFFSAEDRLTHMRMFPAGASVILNPQRCEIMAFGLSRQAISVCLADQEGRYHEITKTHAAPRAAVDFNGSAGVSGRVESIHTCQRAAHGGFKYEGW